MVNKPNGEKETQIKKYGNLKEWKLSTIKPKLKQTGNIVCLSSGAKWECFSLVIFTSIDEVITWYNGYVACDTLPLTTYVTHTISRDRLGIYKMDIISNPIHLVITLEFFFLPVIQT